MTCSGRRGRRPSSIAPTCRTKSNGIGQQRQARDPEVGQYPRGSVVLDPSQAEVLCEPLKGTDAIAPSHHVCRFPELVVSDFDALLDPPLADCRFV